MCFFQLHLSLGCHQLVFELGCLCHRQSGLVCMDSDAASLRWWMIVSCEIFNDIYRQSNVDPALIIVPSRLIPQNRLPVQSLQLCHRSQFKGLWTDVTGAHHQYIWCQSHWQWRKGWTIMGMKCTSRCLECAELWNTRAGQGVLWGRFVCQNASLWESVDVLSNLHVSMTVMVMGFLDQIVVRNDIVWKYFEGHLHVFIPVQGCLEIHILYVRPTKFCAGCADNTGSTWFWWIPCWLFWWWAHTDSQSNCHQLWCKPD